MTQTNGSPSAEQTPIAIVGMSCLFPKAQGLREYWRLLRRSEDGVTDVPLSHWSTDDYVALDIEGLDMTYCGRGAFLSEIDFDPTEFGIPPATLEAIDTAQLLGLMVAKAALRDAGYGPDREFDRSRMSVILGVTGTQELVIPLGARMGHPIWRRAMRAHGVPHDVTDSVIREISDAYVPWQENSFPGLLGNVVAGRIANRLNLRGTNCVVDAACASSLSAIHLSMLELSSGRTDVAISGGVDALNDIFMFMCFSKTQALSPTGDARPFSKDADGTVIGEGVGMVVLKRLEDARRDGDRIYAVIRGIGTSSDGRSQSIYAPRSEGQAEALREAYRIGGVDPATIGLVEAHGTGTKVGDVVEFEALKTVYRESRKRGTWCAIGSVKSQIGHTKAASGVAGVIKAALALYHKVLPPTLKVSEPNPKLEIASSPFYLNCEVRPWIATEDHGRRGCVSAFGFGGSNFHMVLEESSGQASEAAWDGSVHIVALSAASHEALCGEVRAWRAFLAESPGTVDFAYRAKQSREAFDPDDTYRLVLVVEHGADRDRLFAETEQTLVSKRSERSWNTTIAFYGSAAADGKVAFLFPGQGSQYVGMGRDLVCTFPEAMHAIAEADGEHGISERIYPAAVFSDAERSEQSAALTRTDVAQPAIGAVSLAMWRVLERFGVGADVVAGHSYGELAALRAAGRIDDATLRHLSVVRGGLMAEDGGDRGTMAAVQAPPDDIERMLGIEKIALVLAHRNGPSQGVLSGSRSEIDRAMEACESRGWQTTRLNVSGAFHSELMSDAGKRFAAALADVTLSDGTTTVYANCTSDAYPDDPDEARKLLARQLVSPVDFTKQIENMYSAGVRIFVEVGPKSVLTGLVRGILGDRAHAAMAMDASGGRRCGLVELARVLGRLAALGRSVSLAEWEPECPEPVQQKMTISLTGANYRRVACADPGKRDRVSMNDNGKKDVNNARPGGELESRRGPTGSVTSGETSERVEGVLLVVQEGLRAMQALQQQTAAAHQRFLETQDAAQKTFQMVMESQQRLVEKALGLSPSAPVVAAPAAPTPIASPIVAEPAAESPRPAADAASDIERVLIEVVSEITGYPPASIDLTMDLEEDLGIDRVQQVDVLSRLDERIGTERPLNGGQADRIRTLRDIITYCQTGSIPDAVIVEDSFSSDDESEAADGGAGDTKAFETTLLDVVAELTGYPVEMLDPDMDLEADLGIDSIKRVEILAEVQSRTPGMEAVDSSYMGSLRTLRNIMEYMASPAAPAAGTECAAAAKPTCATPVSAACRDQSPLERRVLRSVDLSEAAGGGEITIATGREVWIVDDGTALPRAIGDRMQALGIPSRVVPPDVKPGKKNGDGRIGGLIILSRLRTGNRDVWSPEAEDDLKAAFSLSRRVCTLLGEAAAAGGALFATVSRMDGAFGLRGGSFDPVQGGLAGLAKTFAYEWSDVRCKALDVAETWGDADAAAGAIVRELSVAEPIEVGLDGVARRGLETVECKVDVVELGLGADDVVVVSGGARGVTAETALALAKACQPTLVLLGRSPAPSPEPSWLEGLRDEAVIKRALLEHGFAGKKKPSPAELESAYRTHVANREVTDNIRRLEGAGSRVLYRSVDLRDAAAVRGVVEDIQKDVGAVRALIHGAGVIDDGLIIDKTMERFEKVFDTKVMGLRHLLGAVDAGALRHLVLFGSVSGRFGRKGQVDYAMANEVLNKVAQRCRTLHPAWRVTSINWGPWDGGMVTGALKRDFERQGIELIPLEAGARSLVAEMSRAGGDAAEVVIGCPFSEAIANSPPPRSTGGLSTVFERRLDIERHGFLESHVINGCPVLPVAIVLEWLGHGALHDNPGLLLHGFDDFRVLKGVILRDGPRDLRVAASKVRATGEFYEVDVELFSSAGSEKVLHAQARAILAATLPAPSGAAPPSSHVGPPYVRTAEEIYSEILFHGPQFHGIDGVASIGEAGMTAVVRSAPPPAEWMVDPPRSVWLGDPLVVDAGLQLGILWCHEMLGSVSLPSFGARYRQYRSPLPGGGLTAVLTARKSVPGRLTADVAFLDADSRVVAKMEGFEWTVDPSLGAAFGRASVAVAGS